MEITAMHLTKFSMQKEPDFQIAIHICCRQDVLSAFRSSNRILYQVFQVSSVQLKTFNQSSMPYLYNTKILNIWGVVLSVIQTDLADH